MLSTGSFHGIGPSYWMQAPTAGRRLEFIKARLDLPVSDALGFAVNDFNFLVPAGAFTAVTGRRGRETRRWSDESRTESTATFREVFLASGRSLPIQGRERHCSIRKLERGVEGIAETIIARAGHGRHRSLVSDETCSVHRKSLVDIPHLLMRMPFLLGDNSSDIRSLERMAVDAYRDRSHLLHLMTHYSPLTWNKHSSAKADVGCLPPVSGGRQCERMTTIWALILLQRASIRKVGGGRFFAKIAPNFSQRTRENGESQRQIEFVAQFETLMEPTLRRRHQWRQIRYAPKTSFRAK